MKKLIKNFPIQVSLDRTIMRSHNEFFDFMNKYNSKITLYYSVYQCFLKSYDDSCCSIQKNKYHFCNTFVDKLCFDIDNLNSLEVVKKFHIYCLKNNLKHLILFSGAKGFHVYVFTKKYQNLINSKNALLNSHKFFVKELGLNISFDASSDVDMHIFGDVARLMRLPNTMHMSSNLYCIPVNTDDIMLGKSHIMSKAKNQVFNFVYYGTDFFDVSEHDYYQDKNIVFDDKSISNEEISVDKQKFIDGLPPCIQNVLTQPYVYWKQRFFVIKYLQHDGYSDKEINSYMKAFLSGKKHPIKGHDNYDHFVSENQLFYVTHNQSLFSCNSVKGVGLCPVQGLCDKIQKNPIYLESFS